MKSVKKHSILGLIPLFKVLEESGIDPEILIHKHGINLDHLSGFAQIELKLEFDLIRDAAKLANDPLFGIKVGCQSSFTSYGTFALLVMSAPTFREASQASVQFQGLSLLFSQLSMHHERDCFELRYTMPDIGRDILPTIADRDFAGSYIFLQTLTRTPKAPLTGAGVARPEPGVALRQAYTELLGFEPEFNCAYSYFRIPATMLNQALPDGNALAFKLYRVQAQELMKRFYPETEDLIDQIRQVLAGYDKQFPDIKTLAAMFGMSERTLRRKMEQAGTSYRQMLDEHRRNLALMLLETESPSVSALAEQLGYTEAASFLRAFKRWTGTTPRQFARP